MDIQLIELTNEYRDAFLADRLPEMLGISVPAGWPLFPDIFRKPANPDWPFFLFASKSECAVIGSGGFLSEPDDQGRVQIGYEIAPQYRSRGFATSAMKQVLSLRPEANVVALTDQPTSASASVLSKLGFSLSGSVQPPGCARMYFWSFNAGAA
ncbi:GNAT family N-acetyltransferase [Thermomonas flagellata]|uniref:GNAT family N-acetyltransferase n=1 Tax=Thermomonas flagellata TaxID=2888524 RepID=UPI001F0387BA